MGGRRDSLRAMSRHSISRAAIVRSTIAVAAIALVIGAGLTPAHAIGNIGQIGTGDKPFDVVFSPDGGTAYVSNEVGDSITVIGTAGSSIENTYNVGDKPQGIAISPDGTKLYVACEGANKLYKVDFTSGTVVGINVGSAPTDVDFTPDGTKAFVTNSGSNNISVIATSTFSVSATIATPSGVSDITVSPNGSRAYATGLTDAVVFPITVSTNTLGSAIGVGAGPTSVAFSPDSETAYVTNAGSPYVSVVDVSTAATVGSIIVGTGGTSIAVLPGGKQAYFANAAGKFAALDLTLRVELYDNHYGEFRNLALNPETGWVYLTQPSSDVVQVIGIQGSRVSGPDRYATAVELSKETFAAGADVVYVATGLNFPDALAAGPAAALRNGPLLLTPPGGLPAIVAAEITRLSPDEIVVVGGEGVVSAVVFNQLTALVPATTRTQGSDRYATGRAIVRKAFVEAPLPVDVETVYIATGTNFPDALSAGATGNPVVLVNGAASSLDAATVQLITDLDPTFVKIVGGTGAVSMGIENQLDATSFTVTRLQGADRYATSIAIVRDAFPSGAPAAVLATGTSFPDALAGTPYSAKGHHALIVVTPTCISQDAFDTINAMATPYAILLGGPAALSQNVLDLRLC